MKLFFSDGTTGNIWSPPWHEMTEQEEDAKALEYAEEIAKNRKPVSKFIQLSVYDALENEACKNCDPADFPKCGNCLGV